MKEHVQEFGVRKYTGNDFIELQSEPLLAIQTLLAEYPPCIIQGCELSEGAENTYDISAGMLSLRGLDAEQNPCTKIVPFAGISGSILPAYFTIAHETQTRVYGNGQSKPIAHAYKAELSTLHPTEGVEFLEITSSGAPRLTDVLGITQKLAQEGGQAKDVLVNFATATTRVLPASGSKLGILMGNVSKWFTDLKALAFKDRIAKTDLDTALTAELDTKVVAQDITERIEDLQIGCKNIYVDALGDSGFMGTDKDGVFAHEFLSPTKEDLKNLCGRRLIVGFDYECNNVVHSDGSAGCISTYISGLDKQGNRISEYIGLMVSCPTQGTVGLTEKGRKTTTIDCTRFREITMFGSAGSTDTPYQNAFYVRQDNIQGTTSMGRVAMYISDKDFGWTENPDVFKKKIAQKVDKVTGKGLSESDYTAVEKTKLANISNEIANAFSNAMNIEEISIGGDIDTFYPVLISIPGEGFHRFVIQRNVHQDATAKGSLRVVFETSPQNWGNYISIIKCIYMSQSILKFIANGVVGDSPDYRAQIYLRGNTTYKIIRYFVPKETTQIYLTTTNIGTSQYPQWVGPTTTIAPEFNTDKICVVTSVDSLPANGGTADAVKITNGNEANLCDGFDGTGDLYINYRGAKRAISRYLFFDGMKTGRAVDVVVKQLYVWAEQGTAPLILTSSTMSPNLNADLLDGKHATDFAGVYHHHVGTYEPVFAKNTAFNKNFETSAVSILNHIGTSKAKVGTSTNVARADHVHGMPDIASESSFGFMSSGDKTKMNSLFKIICAGEVAANGDKGPNPIGGFNSTKISEGRYKITTSSPWGVMIFVTGSGGYPAATYGRIDTAFYVITTNGTELQVRDAPFSFIVVQF